MQEAPWRRYNVGMMTATQEQPLMPEFRAAIHQDPLELAAQLSDALAVLDQCRARSINPGDEFLDFVDSLLCEVDMMEVFGRIHAA
ncbi:MAG: hypothetical protein ACRD3E_06045 [Terriglobales bacterium]